MFGLFGSKPKPQPPQQDEEQDADLDGPHNVSVDEISGRSWLVRITGRDANISISPNELQLLMLQEIRNQTTDMREVLERTNELLGDVVSLLQSILRGNDGRALSETLDGKSEDK